MQRSRLREIVLDASRRRKGRLSLSCADAFKIADKHDVLLRDIGRACDLEKIRICRCRLGCFT